MIAQRWGAGTGAENDLGRGYWAAGLKLWVGQDVRAAVKREDAPTLSGPELLAAVRSALGIPYRRQVDAPPKPALTPPSPSPANGHGHHYVLEEKAQPHPCPVCGERRVRGVNGSQRWCIGCGASWPTAASFLAAVGVAAGGQSVEIRREALAARFNGLLPHLSPGQLDQLETTLLNLEKQPAMTGDIYG
jgi:ribosomal protein L37AE/L43A